VVSNSDLALASGSAKDFQEVFPDTFQVANEAMGNNDAANEHCAFNLIPREFFHLLPKRNAVHSH